MDWNFTATMLVYGLSALFIFLAAFVSRQWRSDPKICALSRILFVMLLWSLAAFFEILVAGLEWKVIFIIIENFTSGIFNLMFLFFILNNYWHKLSPGRVMRAALFGIQFILMLLEATNPLHGWVWQGYHAGPDGANVVVFEYGVFYSFSRYFSLLIPVAAIVLLIIKLFMVDREKREGLLWILAASLLPFFSYMVYVLFTDSALGVVLLPSGYALSGLVLSFNFFRETHQALLARTEELEDTVSDLVSEETRRRRLEAKLRAARDVLSNKLARQSRDLASLYDLMIISSKGEPHEDILDACLKKLIGIINCPAIVFYQLHSTNEGTLVSALGMNSVEQRRMALLVFPQNTDRTEIYIQSRRKHPENAFKEFTSSGFKSWAVKIMRIGDIEYGALTFLWKKQHAFEIDEIALLSALSDLVGVIIENDRLRSDERIMTLQEERRRLARDLHDSVTQSLHSLKFSAESAQLVAVNSPQDLDANLTHISASAAQALKEMRLMLYELRLEPLEKIRLVDAVRLRLDTVEKRADIHTEMVVSGAEDIPREWELQLYPIAMEALNNALKHSRSTAVTVRIERGDAFIMQISDNGLGFDSDQPDPGGMGLRSMAERVESIGGRLEIESNPGAGTCVSVIIETSEKDEDAG